ncbi:mu-type opioid receptor-like [Styela clava]|uniref:mu-type opioid receptor-like n=1 Tax=Styela clava TaxID=7725 RepID=UPI00193A9DE9|nr:mu-type opioid receptor-like [Styela clava]
MARIDKSELSYRTSLFINSSLDLVHEEPSLALASRMLFWILSITGLFANFVVVYVIIKYRKTHLQIPSNSLLLSLAITDIACVCIFIAIRCAHVAMEQDDDTIAILVSSDSLLASCEVVLSNWTVTAIAIFNFLSVVYPVKFRIFATRKKVTTIVVCIWLLSTSVSIPVIFFPRLKTFVINHEHSVVEDICIYYIIILDLLSNVPPVLAIVILYPIMLYKLIMKHKQHDRSDSFRKKMCNSIKHISFTYVLFLMYAFFNLAITLTLFIFLATDQLSEIPIPESAKRLLRFMAFMEPSIVFHTVLNPFLHALLTENFKKYYIPSCWKTKGSVSITNT